VTWPFGELPPLSFDVILADPPWRYERWSETNQSKGAADHYDTMEVADIAALPVGHLARGDCLLLLWACGCMLPAALGVMGAWGFAFKSEMIWRKVTPSGKPRMGTGYRVRTLHEPILVGTVGSPMHKAFPSVFDGIAREHSRKPDEFYALVEKHTRGLRRLDLFSRETRPGWAAWGHEVGKFDSEAA
jgi:N6-adenosine-specific RNA methylase IME4